MELDTFGICLVGDGCRRLILSGRKLLDLEDDVEEKDAVSAAVDLCSGNSLLFVQLDRSVDSLSGEVSLVEKSR